MLRHSNNLYMILRRILTYMVLDLWKQMFGRWPILEVEEALLIKCDVMIQLLHMRILMQMMIVIQVFALMVALAKIYFIFDGTEIINSLILSGRRIFCIIQRFTIIIYICNWCRWDEALFGFIGRRTTWNRCAYSNPQPIVIYIQITPYHCKLAGIISSFFIVVFDK